MGKPYKEGVSFWLTVSDFKRDREHLNSLLLFFYFLGCRQQQLIVREMVHEIPGKPKERQRFKNLPFTKRLMQQKVGSDYSFSAGLITGMTSRAGWQIQNRVALPPAPVPTALIANRHITLLL